MTSGAVWSIALGTCGLLITIILWTADRHSKSLDKFERRLSAHLVQEEVDAKKIRESLDEIRQESAATRVDVAFIAGRQGITLPPR